MSWQRNAALLLVTVAMLSGGHAWAWGPEGHAIIAEIAEARLEPAARAKVVQLLALEGHQHLDQIASWADDIRASDRSTGPWHFVDIPLSENAFDPNRDCASGACVVAQIQRFAGILQNPSASPQDRLDALKFLVHFVGDIHQPLHTETDFSTFPPPGGDRGGNSIHVTYFQKPTNLHAVWDGGIIEAALHTHLGPHFTPDLAVTSAEALNLSQAISASDAANWAPDGLAANLTTATVQWANESHALAQAAYQNLPASRSPGWDEMYQGPAWQVVQSQLNHGGVRLAKLLNELLE
jgi:hypothetical protein